MDELQKLDLEFKIEELKLKNELLEEELKDNNFEILFAQVQTWDRKLKNEMIKAISRVCDKHSVSSNWLDVNYRNEYSYVYGKDLDFAKNNDSIGFEILEMIYDNYESETYDEDQEVLKSMKPTIKYFFRLLTNKDYRYLKFILHELFNNTECHVSEIHGVSLIFELINDKKFYSLYDEFLEYIAVKESENKYTKRRKEIEVESNKKKIKILEKRLGSNLITAI